MKQDLSIISLLLNASWVVQAVVVILMLMSVFSWMAIVIKLRFIRNCLRENEEFDRSFWAEPNLNELYATALHNNKTIGQKGRIFASGMKEQSRLKDKLVIEPSILLEGARRAMRAQFQRELDGAESLLPFLGTVGSVAPYIGLFGTVWGIMHAFTGLASLEQVTLATVAPGIAEALAATAIGLFAAIPAVISYNYFANKTDALANSLETFIDECSNTLQRNLGERSRIDL